MAAMPWRPFGSRRLGLDANETYDGSIQASWAEIAVEEPQLFPGQSVSYRPLVLVDCSVAEKALRNQIVHA